MGRMSMMVQELERRPATGMQWGKDGRLLNEGQELEGGLVTGMQWQEARMGGLSVRI